VKAGIRKRTRGTGDVFRQPTRLGVPGVSGWVSARPMKGERTAVMFAIASTSASTRALSPSHRACAGSGCTSLMTPSAPTASAARASGSTSSRRTAECEGSTTTGRWDRRWTTGTALMSSVLRVAVSNVRMRTTSRTPLRLRRLRVSNSPTSPTSPTIVRVTPRLTNASPPVARTSATTASTSCWVASGAITATMELSSRPRGSFRRMNVAPGNARGECPADRWNSTAGQQDVRAFIPAPR
jgi:hypothetical protein